MGRGRIVKFKCPICGYIFYASDYYKEIKCANLKCTGKAKRYKEI